MNTKLMLIVVFAAILLLAPTTYGIGVLPQVRLPLDGNTNVQVASASAGQVATAAGGITSATTRTFSSQGVSVSAIQFEYTDYAPNINQSTFGDQGALWLYRRAEDFSGCSLATPPIVGAQWGTNPAGANRYQGIQTATDCASASVNYKDGSSYWQWDASQALCLTASTLSSAMSSYVANPDVTVGVATTTATGCVTGPGNAAESVTVTWSGASCPQLQTSGFGLKFNFKLGATRTSYVLFYAAHLQTIAVASRQGTVGTFTLYTLSSGSWVSQPGTTFYSEGWHEVVINFISTSLIEYSVDGQIASYTGYGYWVPCNANVQPQFQFGGAVGSTFPASIGASFSGGLDELWFFSQPVPLNEIAASPNLVQGVVCNPTSAAINQIIGGCDTVLNDVCTSANTPGGEYCGWIGGMPVPIDLTQWAGLPTLEYTEQFVQISLNQAVYVGGISVLPVVGTFVSAAMQPTVSSFAVAYSWAATYGYTYVTPYIATGAGSAWAPSPAYVFAGNSAQASYQFANAFATSNLKIIPLTGSAQAPFGMRVIVHACWQVEPSNVPGIERWDTPDASPSTNGVVTSWTSANPQFSYQCNCNAQPSVVAQAGSYNTPTTFLTVATSTAPSASIPLYTVCQFNQDGLPSGICPSGSITKGWSSNGLWNGTSLGGTWVAVDPNSQSYQPPCGAACTFGSCVCQVVTNYVAQSIAAARQFCNTQFVAQYFSGQFPSVVATLVTPVTQQNSDWLFNTVWQSFATANAISNPTSSRYFSVGLTVPGTGPVSYAQIARFTTGGAFSCNSSYVIANIESVAVVTESGSVNWYTNAGALLTALQSNTITFPYFPSGATVTTSLTASYASCVGQSSCTVSQTGVIVVAQYTCAPVPDTVSQCTTVPVTGSGTLPIVFNPATISLTSHVAVQAGPTTVALPAAVVVKNSITAQLTVTIQVAIGTLVVGTTVAGVTVSSSAYGTTGQTVTLTGTVNSLNTVLASITYGSTSFNTMGTTTYSVYVTDTGIQSATDSVVINLFDDLPPTIGGPLSTSTAAITDNQGSTVTLPYLTVTASPVGDLVTIVYSVSQGTLTSTGCASNASFTVQTLQASNFSSVVYNPGSLVSATVTLTVVVSTNGKVPWSQTITRTINVVHVNHPPVQTWGTIPSNCLEAATCTIGLSVTDPDAGDVDTTTISASCGTVTPATTTASTISIVVTPSQYFYGTCTVSVSTTDNGSPSATITSSITVNIANVPHQSTCTGCVAVTVTELQTVNLQPQLVDPYDPETDLHNVTVSVTYGSITSRATPNPSTSIFISSDLNSVNNILNTIVYSPPNNHCTASALWSIQVIEPGFNGNSITNTITINIVNYAPTISFTSTSVTSSEGSYVQFPSITVGDLDCADTVVASVVVSNAIPQPLTTANWIAGIPNTNSRSPSALSTALNCMQFNAGSTYCGVVVVTITVTDNHGAYNSGSVTFNITNVPHPVTIAAASLAPRNITTGKTVSITGIAASDLDANSCVNEVEYLTISCVTFDTVSPCPGTFQVSGTNGFSAPLTVSGSLANINTALSNIVVQHTDSGLNNHPPFNVSISVKDTFPGATATLSIPIIVGNSGSPAYGINQAPSIVTTSLTGVSTLENNAVTVPISMYDIDSYAVSVVAAIVSGSGTLSWTSQGQQVVAESTHTTAPVSLTLTPTQYYNGIIGIRLTPTDSDGGVGSAYVANITVQFVDQAPTVGIVGSAPSLTEDKVGSITGFSVADVDDLTSSVQLTATNGTWSIGSVKSVTVTTSLGASGSSLTISGAITSINQFIAGGGAQWVSDLHGYGAVTFTATATDPSGKSGSNHVSYVVAFYNYPSTITGPNSYSAIENVKYQLNGIVVGDIDSNTFLKVTITSGFTLSIPGVAANNDGSYSIFSTANTPAAINAAINSATFNPVTNFYTGLNNAASPVITLSVSQTATFGTPDQQLVITVNVAHVDQAPVIVATYATTTTSEYPNTASIPFSVSDVDDTQTSVTVVLSNSAAGYLTVTGYTQLSAGSVTTGTTVTLNGGITNVNAALSHLYYVPAAFYNTQGAQIFATATATDPTGNPSASVLTGITVTFLNHPPTITASSVSTSENAASVTFTVSLSDLDIPAQQLSLNLNCTGTAYGQITSQTSFSGLSNTASITATFVPFQNAFGTQTVTITASDGIASTTTTITVSIAHVNQPPALTYTSSYTFNEGTVLSIAGWGLTDVDSTSLQLVLSTAYGTLSCTSTSVCSGSGSAQVTLSGTPAQITASLTSGINFTPIQYLFGTIGNQNAIPPVPAIAVTLFDVYDQAPTYTYNYGVYLTINFVDHAPTLAFTSTSSTTVSQTIPENPSVLTLQSFTISDPDPSTQIMTLTLTPTLGTVTLTQIAGLTYTTTNGAVSCTAARSVLQGILNVPITYIAPQYYWGAASVSITLVESQSDGGLSATPLTINIAVTYVDHAPSLSAGTVATMNQNQAPVSTQVVGVVLSDNDYQPTWGLTNKQYTLTIAYQTYTSGSASTNFTNSAGTSVATSVSGTLTTINAYLANLYIVPKSSDGYGSRYLAIKVVDQANINNYATTGIAITVTQYIPPQTPPTLSLSPASNACVTGITETYTSSSFFTPVKLLDSNTGGWSSNATLTIVVQYGTITASTAGIISSASTNSATSTTTYTYSASTRQLTALLSSIVYVAPTRLPAAVTAQVSVTLTTTVSYTVNLCATIGMINYQPSFVCNAASCGTVSTNENVAVPYGVLAVTDVELADLRLVITGSSLIGSISGNCAVLAAGMCTINGNTVSVRGPYASLSAFLATLVITPTYLTYGQTTVTFTLYDTAIQYDSHQTPTWTVQYPLTVVINMVPQPPSISTSISSITINEDTTFNFGVTVADPDSITITVTVTALNGTLTASTSAPSSTLTGSSISYTKSIAGVNSAFNSILFTPSWDFYGVTTVVVTAVDNYNMSAPAQTITITVNQVAPTITFSSTSLQAVVGTSVTVNVAMTNIDQIMMVIVSWGCGMVTANGTVTTLTAFQFQIGPDISTNVANIAYTLTWTAPNQQETCGPLTAQVFDGTRATAIIATATLTVINPCAFAQYGTPCNDNNPNTINDACIGGTCQGITCTPRAPIVPVAPVGMGKLCVDAMGWSVTLLNTTVSGGNTLFTYKVVGGASGVNGWSFGFSTGSFASLSVKVSSTGLLSSLVNLVLGQTSFITDSHTGVTGLVFGAVTSQTVVISVQGTFLTGPVYYGMWNGNDYGIGTTQGPVDMCCNDLRSANAQVGSITTQICENNQQTLSCPNGQTLKIVSANYGRTQPGTVLCPDPGYDTLTTCLLDAQPYLASLCNGQQSCNAYASNSVYGDPCYLTYKYLNIQYECTGSRSAQVCQLNGKLSLTCPGSETLTVVQATYGADNSGQCPSTTGSCSGTTLNAPSACLVSITATIQAACTQNCTVDPNLLSTSLSASLNLLCSGWNTYNKNLNVVYQCSGDAARGAAVAEDAAQITVSANTIVTSFLRLGLTQAATAAASAVGDYFSTCGYWFNGAAISASSSGSICAGRNQAANDGTQLAWHSVTAGASGVYVPLVSYLSHSVYSVGAVSGITATVHCTTLGTVKAYIGGSLIFSVSGLWPTSPSFSLTAGWSAIVFEVNCQGQNFSVSYNQNLQCGSQIPQTVTAVTSLQQNQLASVLLEFQSYNYGSWNPSWGTSISAFQGAFATFPASSPGYCYTQLNGVVGVSNEVLCNSNQNSNIAERWTVTVYEPTGGAQWQIRMGIDWGHGGIVFLNGAYLVGDLTDNLWWGGSWSSDQVLVSPPVFLQQGVNVFQVWAMEDCCDGSQTWQFNRNGAGWMDLTIANLQQVVTASAGQTSSISTTATCTGGEISVPTPPTPPPLVNVTFGVCNTVTTQQCLYEGPRSQVVCSNAASPILSIQCPFGHQIQVSSAQYGRYASDTTTCGGPTVAASLLLVSQDCFTSALSRVTAMCQNANQCNVQISDSLFAGIPVLCALAIKYLTVSYTCSFNMSLANGASAALIASPTSKRSMSTQQLQPVAAVPINKCAVNAATAPSGYAAYNGGVTVQLQSYSINQAASAFNYRVSVPATFPGNVDTLTIGICNCMTATVRNLNGTYSTQSEAKNANTGTYGVTWYQSAANGDVITAGNGLQFSFQIGYQTQLCNNTWTVRNDQVNGKNSNTNVQFYSTGWVVGPCCSRTEGVSAAAAAGSGFVSTANASSAVRFSYSSYYWQWSTSFYTDPVVFYNSFQGLSQPAGYCSVSATSFASFNNQNLCKVGNTLGSSQNIGFYFRIDFNEPVGGSWTFRFGVDWGHGGVIYIDGQQVMYMFSTPTFDLWWAGSWSSAAVVYTNGNLLSAGAHYLEVWAGETCCDGLQSIQYMREGSGWSDASSVNLQQVITTNDPTPCPATCGCGQAQCQANPACLWNGVQCTPVTAPTGTCASVLPLPANNPASNPWLVINYNSYLFNWNNTVPKALNNNPTAAQFAGYFSNLTQPAGYCSKVLIDDLGNGFTNEGECGAGTNIGYSISIKFHEPVGSTWMFDFGIDWGDGGVVLLDGVQLFYAQPFNMKIDLWWGGSDWTNPAVLTSPAINLAAGSHTLQIYAQENCCDGNQIYRYKRGTQGAWTPLTTTNLMATAQYCQPTPVCETLESTSCQSVPLSVSYPATTTNFNATAFAQTQAALLGLSASAINLISVNAEVNSVSDVKLTAQDDSSSNSVRVMYTVTGVTNDQLQNAITYLAQQSSMQLSANTTAMLQSMTIMSDTQINSGSEAPTATQVYTVGGVTYETVAPVKSNNAASTKIALIIVSVIAVALLWAIVILLALWRKSKLDFINKGMIPVMNANPYKKGVDSGSDG